MKYKKPDHSKQPTQLLIEILDALESLYRDISNLEAMANAAAEVLPHLPYLPGLPRVPVNVHGPNVAELAEGRRQFGRLFAMVAATADSAATTLQQGGELLDRVNALRAQLGMHAAGVPGAGTSQANDSGTASYDAGVARDPAPGSSNGESKSDFTYTFPPRSRKRVA